MEKGFFMKKNGKLEFYRFFFCLAIMLFHFEKYIMGEPPLQGLHIMLFPHGSMGVEFFFLLSGFFMGRSAFRDHQRMAADDRLFSEESSRSALRFLWKKYRRILPEHAVAFVITFIIYCIYKRLTAAGIVFGAVESIPAFLLLQMSGLGLLTVNHIEWYISAMLLGMALLYPICRRYYYGFTRYVSPLLSLFIIGFFFHDSKALTGVMTWMGFSYKGTIRAVVELSLGATIFEITRYIADGHPLSIGTLRFTRAAEIVSFCGVTLFMLLTLQKKYEVYALACMMVLLISAVVRQPASGRFFDRPLFYFLGEFSFPLYLSQLSAVYIANAFLSQRSYTFQVSMCVIITFSMALVVRFAAAPLRKMLSK